MSSPNAPRILPVSTFIARGRSCRRRLYASIAARADERMRRHAARSFQRAHEDADDGKKGREARALAAGLVHTARTFADTMLQIRQFEGWNEAGLKTQQKIEDGISRIFAQEQENINTKKLFEELDNKKINKLEELRALLASIEDNE